MSQRQGHEHGRHIPYTINKGINYGPKQQLFIMSVKVVLIEYIIIVLKSYIYVLKPSQKQYTEVTTIDVFVE